MIATQVAQKVELLRQKQRAQLVKSLKGVDVFPDYPICDSALLPMMSNQVRRTCASFPAQARELVNGGVRDVPGLPKGRAEPDVPVEAGAGRAQAEKEAARGARGQKGVSGGLPNL